MMWTYMYNYIYTQIIRQIVVIVNVNKRKTIEFYHVFDLIICHKN